MRAVVVLALIGCRGPSQVGAVAVEPASAPLSIGFAGAPTSLFGTVEDPDFVGPFAVMAEAGADQFFPLFLQSEVDGQAQTTGHLAHFLSPELLGSTDVGTCRGASDPYEAAQGQLHILFPGFVLLQLQPPDEPLDGAVLTDHLTAQRDDCWADHGEIISAFDTYDEPALTYALAQVMGQPALELDNIAVATQVVRDVLDLPTTLIEGPGPLLFSDPALTSTERDALERHFQDAQAQVADVVDTFGFDVYPVPDHPLTEPGAYVQRARALSPDGRIVSVLQGFGFEQTTLGDAPGRLPTRGELQFMALDSVAAGADELLWYGQSALDLDVPPEAALWDDLLTVTADIAQLRDVVTRPVVLFEQSNNHALRAHGDNSSTTLIVVNRMATDQTFTIPLTNATSATPILGRHGTLTDEVLTTTLAPFSASVFDITTE